ncbi:MotA/TolQ/ExbB proton channel family protein [Nannocystis sp. SCPEA4]|uniref:MotA/TolQ/ExbB proton channel family protein n=1 Tax=Nannocystis sp. SCPEA4 TaxID=2996787 RepID=UPI00226E97E4|nr:MotA/TolQ/ExbB proton channel family protein [Nannocystis sp. SCPEA4]MCY1059638.1 MotA/TolQ/ExbB proton channel family protein [Nannocystis sp. SCPEA4]
MNVVDELIKIALLGATWVLYLLFALSVLSIAAMVERWLFFRKNRAGGEALRRDLLKAIAARDGAQIDAALVASKTVEAEVLRQALLFRDGGAAAFLDAVESGLAAERAGLDRGTVLLGTIGNNAPFVGLFGTVLGIIEAFSYLGTGDQAAMGNVMSGISEALVATAVGIFVAIPAVIGFNVAQKKAGELENSVLSLARLLSAWIKLEEALEAEHADPDNLARLPDRGARRPLEPIRSGGT